MEVLKILVTVAGMVAYAAVVFFAIAAWFRLREMERRTKATLRGVSLLTTLAMGHHVKENFEEVNRMKRAFEQLVEEERYEDAERMKSVIDKAERDAERALEHFKDTFGEVMDITVTKVGDTGARG